MLNLDFSHCPLQLKPRKSKYRLAALGVGATISRPKAEAKRVGAAAKQWKRRHVGWDYSTKICGDRITLTRVA